MARIVLIAAAVLALAGTSAAARTPARIWLVSPAVVRGSGFPPGKVTVTAVTGAGKAVRVVRASRTGRFTARFGVPIKASGCADAASVVSAVGVRGVRATLTVAGNAKDCAPPAAP